MATGPVDPHSTRTDADDTYARAGLSTRRLDRIRAMLTGYVERGDLPGAVALIGRRGAVHVVAVGTKSVGGGDPVRRDTIFRIASMTKPIAAVAAMILVEECTLRLDEPVDAWLPELTDRRVLKRLDGPLDDTVPAYRPITLRDLLTLRMGIGYCMELSGEYPIRQAFNAQGILQGPPKPHDPPAPDEWMRRVGTLPLLYQPGEQWLYDFGLDVLGVLIARAAGQPLETFLRDRLFAPLGMKDTGFSVPAAQINRLAASYATDHATGKAVLYDEATGGQWSRPPVFPSAAGGLVSTADDYLAFGQMLLDGGKHGRARILSRPSVELMTPNHLTDAQRAGAGRLLGEHGGWGLGMGVTLRRGDLTGSVGAFGWSDGLGTTWHSDPKEQMVGILLTQRAMDSPIAPAVLHDFWTSAYGAIDD